MPEISETSNMDAIIEQLKDAMNGKMKEKIENDAREIPNASNEVEYPDEFHNWTPVITAAPMQQGKVATIIIATESPGYPQESFDTDVKTTLRYFNMDPDDSFSHQAILLKPATKNILDSADARQKLKRVVDLMNRSTVVYASNMQQSAQSDLPSGGTLHSRLQGEVTVTTHSSYILRIVLVGVKAAHRFIFKALEYLVNQWMAPNKYVQFVTSGEIKAKGELLDFWTSACVNQLVEQVQFVHLDRYLPFGFYEGECKKMHKSRPEFTDQPSRDTVRTAAITD